MDKAQANRDVNGVTAAYTKDWVSVTMKGRTNALDEERQMMTKLFALVKSFSTKSAVASISVEGSTAAVRVKQHGTMVIVNRQTNAISTFVLDHVSEDTWVKTGSAWLQKKCVEKSAKATVNGKPITSPG